MVDTCVICGQGQTVDSHLMPQAIGRDIRGNQKNFWIGSREADGKLITQNGVFDRFLCASHEAAIHDYEDYAIDFIRDFELTAQEKAGKSFARMAVVPRAWYIDADEEQRDAELALLKAEIYRRDVTLPMRRIDGRDRFSELC